MNPAGVIRQGFLMPKFVSTAKRCVFILPSGLITETDNDLKFVFNITTSGGVSGYVSGVVR